MKKLGKNRVLTSVSIVLLSIIVFLIIIAIILKIDEYKRSFYTIDVTYKTNGVVELNNILPMSDDIGKNYSGKGIEKGIVEYKEFTVTNPNPKKVTYEIYLNKIDIDSKYIRSNYIKLYLTDENNKPIEGFDKTKMISFYDLYSLNDNPGGRLLYSGSLDSGKSKTFILRSWVADTYVLSNDKEEFSFNINVRLK